MKTLFEYDSYKSFLEDKLGSKSVRKGIKSQLANAMNCQPTYISQVLHGHAHLSLEQVDLLNQFFGHNSAESKFMILLVQKDRAGTNSLRKHFSDEMEEIRTQRLNLTSRLGKKSVLSSAHQSIYYSSWQYAAIHIALTIPDLRKPSALSQFFQLPLRRVNKVLDFLVEVGLAEQKSPDHYKVGSSQVRLGNDSPNIYRHHANWRMRAIDSLEGESPLDLHYSGVVSLSKKDVVKIKDNLLNAIKENIEIVQDSSEEEIYSFCIDFFNLGKSQR